MRKGNEPCESQGKVCPRERPAHMKKTLRQEKSYRRLRSRKEARTGTESAGLRVRDGVRASASEQRSEHCRDREKRRSRKSR